jgi:hypothetical protein
MDPNACWKEMIDAMNDGDGLTNSEELSFGTDKNKTDTDDDGLNDHQEVIELKHCNPLSTDSDNDGILDVRESTKRGDCIEADFDGDGVADTLDCAPEDANRFPGNVDALDGVDRDCKIDAPTCLAPSVPTNCGGLTLGGDVGDGNSYCVGVTVVPGTGRDPFIDAKINFTINRQKSGAPISNTPRMAYELDNAPESDCGPVAPGSFLPPDFNQSVQSTIDFGDSVTTCDFVHQFGFGNTVHDFTKIQGGLTVTQPLLHTLAIHQTAIKFSNLGGYNFLDGIIAQSCQFGD